MLKTILLGGAVAMTLSVAAFAQSDMSAPGGMPAAGAPMATPDYITAASQSDEFEIQEGQMAQSMAKDPRVKRFGAMMVRDHTHTTDTLHKAIMKAGMPVPPPPPLRPDQQQMVTQLQGMSGAEFDDAYLAQQMPAHQEALALQTSYSKAGDVKPIRAAAASAVPIVQEHIAMLQKMQDMAQ